MNGINAIWVGVSVGSTTRTRDAHQARPEADAPVVIEQKTGEQPLMRRRWPPQAVR